MHRNLDRDKLLAALSELSEDRDEALATLPEVLSLQGEGHVTVSIVDPDGILRITGSNDAALAPGTVVPGDGIVAATVREGRSTYVTSTHEHPSYRTLAAPLYPVEFALPIFERGAVVAVLNLERERPLLPVERHALEVFTSGVSRHITQTSRSREATISAELSLRLVGSRTVGEAAKAALDIITPAVGSSAAAILTDRRGRMAAIAHHGAEGPRASALERGTPYPHGLAWEACLTGAARLTRDYQRDPRGLDALREMVEPVVVAVPIEAQPARRFVLCLEFTQVAQITSADIETLQSAGRQLATIFTNIQGRALQDHLLDLHTSAFERDAADLYQRVLDAAVEHVPGAEAGSLLLRRDNDGDFSYQAVNGFDFELLKDTCLPEENMRRWYDSGDSEWSAGRARILSADSLDLAEFSRLSGDREEPVKAGNLDHLKCTACLPVVYRGEVLAILNLDNFTRPDAFGSDSLHVLKQFASPVAALLASARHRDELTRASRTDPLTGLANRNGFGPELERHHARGLRDGRPYSVLVMDLTGFKVVNDTLGHAAGDVALKAVAAALSNAAREGDIVARWGGDEFVALLAGADAAAAADVGERFRRLIENIHVGGYQLGLDVGIATFPDEGVTSAELLRVADADMYLNKRKGRRAPVADLAELA